MSVGVVDAQLFQLKMKFGLFVVGQSFHQWEHRVCQKILQGGE